MGASFHVLQNAAVSAACACAVILIAALVLLPLRAFLHPPAWVFRKLLHLTAVASTLIAVCPAFQPLAGALSCLLLAFAAWLAVSLVQKVPWFSELFSQKHPGEIRSGTAALYLLTAALTIFSGWFGRFWAAPAAILVWGVGDAAAALIGIPFGRHRLACPQWAQKKSLEGSAAMALVSALALIFCLCNAGFSAQHAVLWAALIGILASLTELLTPFELDNVAVPVVVFLLLMLC